MYVTRRMWMKPVAVLGFAGLASAVTGCQTYPAGFGGLTLPSPHYLKHYPQYFPPDPQFPLQRELDSMQDPGGPAVRGVPGAVPGVLPAAPGVLPPPAPFGPAPGGGTGPGPTGPTQATPPAGNVAPGR